MRSLIVGILAALCAVPVTAQNSAPSGSQQDQTPVFRKNVNVVNLFFTVKGKHGALVPGLTRDEFEVFEDGKPQTIKYFSAVSNQPLTLGILVDSSGSMQNMLPEEKIVAGDFLRQVITDKDLAFIISFDISVDLLQDPTSDVHMLRQGLERARINVGGGSSGVPGIGQGPIPVSRPKGTLLYDGVYLAADEVLSKQVGRKAMIVLTDGGFHAATGDPPNLKVCHRGEWNDRMAVETVLSMLTVVCHTKHLCHRVWAAFRAHLGWLLAVFNVLAQWHGLTPDDEGRIRLSIAAFSL